MAGPTASVLLREPLIRARIREMYAWLSAVASMIEGHPGQRGAWDIWMDGAPLGCPTGEHQCTISIVVQDHGTHQEEDSAIQRALGYRPAQEILISAGCNGKIDHCLSGRIALHFAQQFDAVVDMYGTITPPVAPYHSPSFQWPTVDEVRRFLADMPGTVWEIYFEDETDAPDFMPTHIVDATFLEAWIGHPHFHMIK